MTASLLSTMSESVAELADWAARPSSPPPFRERFEFSARKREASCMLHKYPDRVPVIVEISKTSSLFLDKMKYLVPADTTVGQFMFIIRRRMRLDEGKALFLFFSTRKILVPTSMTISRAHHDYKDPDEFLYMTLCEENTFG